MPPSPPCRPLLLPTKLEQLTPPLSLSPTLPDPSQIPTSIEGLSVLDLGCGSGRDCYLASCLVGPTGKVTGIDMTAEQLVTARAHVDEFTATMG